MIGDDDGLTFEAQVQKKKTKRLRKDGSQIPDQEESRGHKLGRLRERVVLYDATIQSIESVKELRGAMRDAKFVDELDGKIGYFRALKCINIATSHTFLGQHTNALALLARAQAFASKIATPSSSAAADSPPTLDLTASSISAIQSQSNALLARTHALVELQSLQSTTSSGTYLPPLVHNLAEFYPPPGEQVDLKNLVSYPPKLEPVPVKPILLDVAWNYIEYPGRKAKGGAEEKAKVNGSREEVQAKPEEKKRGWFGFGR